MRPGEPFRDYIARLKTEYQERLASYPPERGTRFAVFAKPSTRHLQAWLHPLVPHHDRESGWRVTYVDTRPEYAHVPFSGHQEYATFDEALEELADDRYEAVSVNQEPELRDPAEAFQAASDAELERDLASFREDLERDAQFGGHNRLRLAHLIAAYERELQRRTRRNANRRTTMSLAPERLAVFDFDGTLIDEAGRWREDVLDAAFGAVSDHGARAILLTANPDCNEIEAAVAQAGLRFDDVQCASAGADPLRFKFHRLVDELHGLLPGALVEIWDDDVGIVQVLAHAAESRGHPVHTHLVGDSRTNPATYPERIEPATLTLRDALQRRIELVPKHRRARDAAPLTVPSDVAAFAHKEIGTSAAERAIVIALDSHRRPLGVVQVGQGGVAATEVPPVQVMQALLLANAAGFFLVHNHPSGKATPSLDDHRVAERLAELAKLHGIVLVDWLVVTPQGDYWSNVQHGGAPEWLRPRGNPSSEPSSASAARMIRKAVAEYGLTDDIYSAGFVLPRGEMLDFGEGQGGRSLDHRHVNQFVPESAKRWCERNSGAERACAMAWFQAAGPIRVIASGDYLGIDVVARPTREQIRALAEHVGRFENVEVDIGDERGRRLLSRSFDAYEVEAAPEVVRELWDEAHNR